MDLGRKRTMVSSIRHTRRLLLTQHRTLHTLSIKSPVLSDWAPEQKSPPVTGFSAGNIDIHTHYSEITGHLHNYICRKVVVCMVIFRNSTYVFLVIHVYMCINMSCY